jgi:hypothetical protein
MRNRAKFMRLLRKRHSSPPGVMPRASEVPRQTGRRLPARAGNLQSIQLIPSPRDHPVAAQAHVANNLGLVHSAPLQRAILPARRRRHSGSRRAEQASE